MTVLLSCWSSWFSCCCSQCCCCEWSLSVGTRKTKLLWTEKKMEWTLLGCWTWLMLKTLCYFSRLTGEKVAWIKRRLLLTVWKTGSHEGEKASCFFLERRRSYFCTRWFMRERVLFLLDCYFCGQFFFFFCVGYILFFFFLDNHLGKKIIFLLLISWS